MNGIFELSWPDVAISLDEITGIGPTVKDARGAFREVRLREGANRTISTHQIDEMMRRPQQLMKADPGTYMLRVWVEDGIGELNRSPVIAWALCVDGEVRVVTPQGVNDGMETRDSDIYALMPDGSVQSVGAYSEPIYFDSTDEYVAHEVAKKAEKSAAASGSAA